MSGAATTRAIARDQGIGTGVGVGCEYGPAIPSDCSEAAAVWLVPSVMLATDIGRAQDERAVGVGRVAAVDAVAAQKA